MVRIYAVVPQRLVGLVLGKYKSNIRKIEEECCVTITWPTKQSTGEICVFTIEGSSQAKCEKAEKMITESQKPTQMDERKVPIPKEFIGLINGQKGHTIAQLKTRSRANIWFPELSSQPEGEMAIFIVQGLSENCDKAVVLIKNKISSAIEHKRREELGGAVRFACFSCNDPKNEFRLVKCGNDCSSRAKYRIVSDNYQEENELFSHQTVANIKCHLSKSLQTLHKLKDDKELTVDLWCHFCKIVLENVQEDELANEIVTGEYINRRIANVFNVEDEEAYWKTTFGEYVDPSEVNIGTFPESTDSEDELLNHAQTLWRYDCGFISPTGLEMRLKVWEGLPAQRNEPPDEVKNILQQVFFKGEEGDDVKAWLCYPSATVVKGDIMAPFSKYDCRMKLRAGPRRVDKNDVKQEEMDILVDYLSNCTIDKSNHKLVLPDEKSYKIPQEFLCNFYREANEKTFYADMDDERYTVIVFHEKGWDSMFSQKTDKKEFGIRVVMDSWSKALLSPDRNWEPVDILNKLDKYMDFLSVLYSHLFDE